MKNGTGQLALIIILMLALFLQIEGVVPDIFAGSEEPLVMTSEKEGLEFNIVLDHNSFTVKDELIIKADITNRSDKPLPYHADTRYYGVRGALGAALYSIDGASKFTDKFTLGAAKINKDMAVLDGELMPGETVNCEFNLLPYFIEKGTKNTASSGDYILKLWYNRGTEGAIEVEFPVAIVKGFGRMHIKG